METEGEKKKRNVTPRSETHQAVLDAAHKFCKNPFDQERDALLKAMLEHKRAKFGSVNVSAL